MKNTSFYTIPLEVERTQDHYESKKLEYRVQRYDTETLIHKLKNLCQDSKENIQALQEENWRSFNLKRKKEREYKLNT